MARAWKDVKGTFLPAHAWKTKEGTVFGGKGSNDQGHENDEGLLHQPDSFTVNHPILAID